MKVKALLIIGVLFLSLSLCGLAQAAGPADFVVLKTMSIIEHHGIGGDSAAILRAGTRTGETEAANPPMLGSCGLTVTEFPDLKAAYDTINAAVWPCINSQVYDSGYGEAVSEYANARAIDVPSVNWFFVFKDQSTGLTHQACAMFSAPLDPQKYIYTDVYGHPGHVPIVGMILIGAPIPEPAAGGNR